MLAMTMQCHVALLKERVSQWVDDHQGDDGSKEKDDQHGDHHPPPPVRHLATDVDTDAVPGLKLLGIPMAEQEDSRLSGDVDHAPLLQYLLSFSLFFFFHFPSLPFS